MATGDVRYTSQSHRPNEGPGGCVPWEQHRELREERNRLHRWLSHIAAYPDEFSPAVKAAREALAGFDTKPEWRYASGS